MYLGVGNVCALLLVGGLVVFAARQDKESANFVVKNCHEIVATVRLFLSNVARIEPESNLRHYIELWCHFRSVILVMSSVLLVLLLPTYGVLSLYYATYTYTYAWSV